MQMGLHGDNFLRHGACLVLSSPLDMGGFWRSAAAHTRQNLVQYPPRDFVKRMILRESLSELLSIYINSQAPSQNSIALAMEFRQSYAKPSIYVLMLWSSGMMSKTKPFFSCWFQKQPGVVRVLTYKDIPGINSPDTPYDPNLHQELLCSGQVLYAGQAVALVLAGRMAFCFTQFHGRINPYRAGTELTRFN